MSAGPVPKIPPRTLPKKRVKTGCRTCKIRRVKCDESRPACQRCLSTGRTCDGYGIWGGGNNLLLVRPAPATQQIGQTPFSLHLNKDDALCFEWFRTESTETLPCVFQSTFWSTLVLQVGAAEPAVLEASLALASVHRRQAMNGVDESVETGLGREQLEVAALQHYSKAIRNLQRHFSVKSKDSIRVVLVTCVVFICTEYLGGRYRAGTRHLKNGLELLHDLIGGIGTGRTRDLNGTDSCLVELLQHLGIQASFLGHAMPILISDQNHIPLILPSIPLEFESLQQAKQSLDGLFLQIHQMATRNESDTAHPPSLIHQKHLLQLSLNQWEKAYAACLTTFNATNPPPESVLSTTLLPTLHTLATILATTTSLDEQTDESIYDNHTPSFQSIIQAIEYLFSVSGAYIKPEPPSSAIGSQDSSHTSISTGDMTGSSSSSSSSSSSRCVLGTYFFTPDSGMILPLYYTAIKCRVPWLRRRAAVLMRRAPLQEGVWEGGLVGRVVDCVIRVEERHMYERLCKGFDGGDGYGDSEWVVPLEWRVRDVVVDLPDGERGKMVVSCKRISRNGVWEDYSIDCA